MCIADLWMTFNLPVLLCVYGFGHFLIILYFFINSLVFKNYHFLMVSNDLAKSVKSSQKSKKMKSSDVLTGIGHMPSSRVLHEWPFPCDSMVCGHLRWKMACRACFKSGHCPGKGNDQHFYLRSQGWYLWNFAQQVFFQCRWPQTIESQGNGHSCKTLLLGIWPIPVKTSDDFNFIDFWLDFTDFATW